MNLKKSITQLQNRMKRLQCKFQMIEFLFTILLMLSLGGCINKIAEKKVETSITQESTHQLQAEIYPIILKLDTTSQFQNKKIEPEDSSFFGNEKYLIHLSQGDDIGYVLFKMENKFYISLVEWNNRFKIIGISEISTLKEGEEYIELLYSDLPINSVIFGKISKTNSIIKTVKAWQINNIKKTIEEIDPKKVDFTETYNTDTD